MTHALDSIFGDDRGENPGGAAIELTDELRRVIALPQRDADSIAAAIAEPLSRRLRTSTGSMTLRPLQALALAEAHDYRGLLVLLPVGEGKTLITLLLPVLLEARRPVLIIPAALREKTEREFAQLSEHWKTHPDYEIVSYELISNRPELLHEIAPDVVIADEADAFKNTKAACTRRMYRYLRDSAKEEREVTFCALAGTMSNRSFREWWHLQQWALPAPLQPLPYSYPAMQSWAQALDEKVTARRPTGELWRLVDPNVPHASMPEIRTAFGKRLRRTPAVITADGSDVDASLRIEYRNRRVPEIENALDEMRRTWCTPGGEEFSEAADLWRHAREIANGFYYVWDPEPPDWWMEPRRVFHKFVRGVLRGSRTLDTMAQVADMHAGEPAVREWFDVRDKYTPHTVPVWLTDAVLDEAVEYAQANRAIVWVEHRAVGDRIAERYRLPYFGEGGVDSSGASILNHDGAPCVASTLAIYKGFNLQAWSHNFILNAYPVGARYEQLLGRTHRFGQQADAVHVVLLFTADEQRDGFEQARRDAEYAQQTTGQRQKLCIADYL